MQYRHVHKCTEPLFATMRMSFSTEIIQGWRLQMAITSRSEFLCSATRQIARIVLCALMLKTSASQAQDSENAPDLENLDSARETLMVDVRAYQQAIAKVESSDGAFAPAITEQLLGLGLALQRNGDHTAALDAFKRGVHISRINDGLYNTRQIAFLEGEIASHVALGAFEEADERQRYLYRVQAQTLSDVTRGQALMQHALWQRQAYEVGIGEDPFARLIRMWSLYRLALTEFANAEGEASPILLEPLHGMLRSQYLISGFVGENTNGRYRSRGVYSDEESQQIAYRAQSYKQGTAVIRAIYDVQVAQPTPQRATSAKTLLMLADWQWWHGKRNEALESYASLYGELAEEGDAQELIDELFAEPQALPALAGVRAFPETLAEREDLLLLEFTVTERGRVADVQRMDGNEGITQKADEVVRRLRQTLFRPRFSDGMPVETTAVRRAYDVSVWQ